MTPRTVRFLWSSPTNQWSGPPEVVWAPLLPLRTGVRQRHPWKGPRCRHWSPTPCDWGVGTNLSHRGGRAVVGVLRIHGVERDSPPSSTTSDPTGVSNWGWVGGVRTVREELRTTTVVVRSYRGILSGHEATRDPRVFAKGKGGRRVGFPKSVGGLKVVNQECLKTSPSDTPTH